MEGGQLKSRSKQTNRKLSVRKANVLDLDPNMPEIPALPSSDFFCFAVDFKKEFRAKNHPTTPIKKLMQLLSAAQAEWHTMSDVDKAPYVEMAKKSKKEYFKRCEEYWKSMDAYNRKRAATEKADKEHSEEAR